MTNYLQHNGWHFNHKMCEFAVSKMRKDGRKLQMMNKSEVDSLLSKVGISLENNELWDYIYVANMCKADFLGSSVIDDTRMAKYIKDVIDDEDAYDGIVFNRWYADMCKKGIPIDWEEML